MDFDQMDHFISWTGTVHGPNSRFTIFGPLRGPDFGTIFFVNPERNSVIVH